MRTEIIDYIQGQNLGGYTLTQELPWTSNGLALYLKNPKRIYIDRTQYNQEPLVETLDGLDIANEITSIKVYFSNDAKLLPSNYESLIDQLKGAKTITSAQGYRTRECIITTTFEEDLLVTELEFRFTKTT